MSGTSWRTSTWRQRLESNKSGKPLGDAESDHESEDDDLYRRTIPAVELVNMGGGDNDTEDADVEDVPIGEVSSFPLADATTAMSL